MKILYWHMLITLDLKFTLQNKITQRLKLPDTDSFQKILYDFFVEFFKSVADRFHCFNMFDDLWSFYVILLFMHEIALS